MSIIRRKIVQDNMHVFINNIMWSHDNIFKDRRNQVKMGQSLWMKSVKLLLNGVMIMAMVVIFLPTAIYRGIKRLLVGHPHHPNPWVQTHEDVFKTKDEVLRQEGFRIQEFDFPTQDGAYVACWRIVTEDASPQSKPPVLLMHGLLDCSMTWFAMSDKKDCLPYMLAVQGYDVWVGNNRGTKYSLKNHQKEDYWNYTIDHLIHYDMPALITSILQHSQHEKVIYIGHSQGTTQFLSAMDVRSQLREKIKCFCGFGPIVGFEHLPTHELLLMMEKTNLCLWLKKIGFRSFMIIPLWMAKMIGMKICYSRFYRWLFRWVVEIICGKNQVRDKICHKRFGVIISQEPGGSSLTNLQHWVQMYRGKKIRKYCYGQKKNIQLYGSTQPPVYTFESLKNLPFHCYFFRGTSDRVSTQADFNSFRQHLHPEKHTLYEVPDYAHLDYLWSEEATKDIYPEILKIVQENQ